MKQERSGSEEVTGPGNEKLHGVFLPVAAHVAMMEVKK